MIDTAARALRLAAKLDALLAANASAQTAALGRINDGDLSPEADAAADATFWRGETLAARRLRVERYLPCAVPLAA
jgi:hypothetical protein